MKPKVLIISFSEIRNDPRVMRQINALKDSFDITAVGYGERPDGVFSMRSIEQRKNSVPEKILGSLGLVFGRCEWYYWNNRNTIQSRMGIGNNRFDLILANEVDALPLALEVSNGVPVHVDLHEFAPDEFSENLLWRIIMAPYRGYLCRTYLGKAAQSTTVGRAIAAEYGVRFQVNPKVVYNAPEFVGLHPTPVSDPIRLIHHGAAIRSRRIELMIETMKLLDHRFSLDLMLVNSDSSYFTELQMLAEKTSGVRIIPPVPMREIPSRINAYDMGIYLLPPNNFNSANALPNKFFEFVQGRLGIAVGPSVEMAQLVTKYDLGIVSDDFSAQGMASALNSLTLEQVAWFKRHADIAARDLCFEKSRTVFCELIDSLVRTRIPPGASKFHD